MSLNAAILCPCVNVGWAPVPARCAVRCSSAGTRGRSQPAGKAAHQLWRVGRPAPGSGSNRPHMELDVAACMWGGLCSRDRQSTVSTAARHFQQAAERLQLRSMTVAASRTHDRACLQGHRFRSPMPTPSGVPAGHHSPAFAHSITLQRSTRDPGPRHAREGARAGLCTPGTLSGPSQVITGRCVRPAALGCRPSAPLALVPPAPAPAAPPGRWDRTSIAAQTHQRGGAAGGAPTPPAACGRSAVSRRVRKAGPASPPRSYLPAFQAGPCCPAPCDAGSTP